MKRYTVTILGISNRITGTLIKDTLKDTLESMYDFGKFVVHYNIRNKYHISRQSDCRNWKELKSYSRPTESMC